jgi:hypothetical protein
VALPARPRQTIDDAGGDRISDQHEHDRHGAQYSCHHLKVVPAFAAKLPVVCTSETASLIR